MGGALLDLLTLRSKISTFWDRSGEMVVHPSEDGDYVFSCYFMVCIYNNLLIYCRSIRSAVYESVLDNKLHSYIPVNEQ